VTATRRSIRSRTIDLDGPVHYADFGGDGATMVLVHGLGGAYVNWLGVGAALAERARVLAPDLAGFGRTPLAGRSATVRANRALLARFVDAVAGEPVILVGNSMGGLISMIEAAERPHMVRGLVLVGPAQPLARGGVDALVTAAFAAYGLPLVGGALLRARAALQTPRRTVLTTLRLCCVDPERIAPEVVEAHVALARERLEHMPWANRAFLQAARSVILEITRRTSVQRTVRRIAAPTLLIQGTADRLVRLAASRGLAASRPDWTFEVFDGVGHVPQMEASERFVDTVRRWMDAHVPAAPSTASETAQS
jgi:pimeloyl-ACP methyl ester carboxylesterase